MLIPLRNNILIAGIEDPDTWYGSSLIARPETTKDRCDQGIIKAIGPAVRELKIGDYVTFSPYAGTLINDADEGDKLIMLSEDGVIAVVTAPTTVVENVIIATDVSGEYIPATAEALILLLREAYQNMPRVIEQKQKWEQRFGS